MLCLKCKMLFPQTEFTTRNESIGYIFKGMHESNLCRVYLLQGELRAESQSKI